MINLLLIGKGVWGQKYISTLSSFPNILLNIATRDNWKNLINNNPDGIIVCTPPQSHVEIASYALEKNIPSMIEKPLSLSLKEAETLKRYTAPILVNHIHLFSHRYQHIKENLSCNSIQSVSTCGQGNSIVRDYSELWDYGPHDISMILDLLQQMPQNVICQKIDHRLYNIELQFNNFISKTIIGYNSSQKIRYLRVNDFEYDGTIFNEPDRPLTNALKIFIDAIDGKIDNRLGLDLPLRVMEILERCQEYLISGY